MICLVSPTMHLRGTANIHCMTYCTEMNCTVQQSKKHIVFSRSMVCFHCLPRYHKRGRSKREWILHRVLIPMVIPLKLFLYMVPSSSADIRDFKMLGRQRRHKRQRTIVLITEYNSCTLDCGERATCSPSSSVIRRGKLTFGVLSIAWTPNNKIRQS